MDNQFIENLQKNYDRIVNYFGFDHDKQFLISLASKYTIENKQFSGVLLSKIADQISESMKIRRDHLLIYQLAASLLNKGNIEENIEQLKEKDQALHKVGFKKSIHRALAAMSLDDEFEAHAKRAKRLFDELKQHQRFLTSNEDIPYVVSLTIDEMHRPTMQAKTVIQYYQQLKEHDFFIGNHLQALSFVMTFYDEEYNDILLKYVVQLRKELEKRNIMIRKVHYPFLGLLALSQTDSGKIEEITSLYHDLIQQKFLRRSKSAALIVAVQKTVQNVERVPEELSISKVETLWMITDFILLIDLLPLNIGEIIDFFN